MRVVLHTQEQAGIDLVCDGELYRFDLNHPETNGMIEYFTRPMGGIRSEIGFSEWLAYSKGAGMRFRARPPGVVEGPVAPARLNLSLACARAKRLAEQAAQVHAHRPAHAGEDAARPALPQPREARARDRRRAGGAGEAPGRGRDPGRRGEPAGPPRRMEVGGGGDQQGAEGGAEEGEGRRAPVLRQLRRAEHPERRLGQAARLPERAARRPHRDGSRAPAARGTGGVQGTAARHRLRPGRGGHQAHRDRKRRRDRARHRARGEDPGPRAA